MLMTRRNLADHSEALLKDCLRRHLPPGTAVYLFGSRARGDNRWNSDFDLWIDADLPRKTQAEILDEIDESVVPFHIDLVTTPALTGPFGAQVRKEAKRWM